MPRVIAKAASNTEVGHALSTAVAAPMPIAAWLQKVPNSN
eukprot:CAMPEP_0202860884 /NCGR_PEP_ID=MMETSP1391-20130828/2468_1 /ASSEMBLY_ACC=CAM_ASM_000867 /TAXON_ID=1034604 /ORGANISM="Chlamydomonas leiostraca, Strain SAG 11-49" /LENGTH=39 /DNA_ID= /DNA_START= /DNA_END= /DNA_ORIENTATION=